MAKNIELMGAVFPDVPSIKLPQYGGGLVSFDDTSDADAVAGDIAQGKTAYVNGVKVVGTNQGGGGGDEPEPTDGKTHIWIHIDPDTPANRLTFPLYFGQSVANGVTVDWGDGSATETFAGTSATTHNHTYATGGDYEITLDVTDGTLNLTGTSRLSGYAIYGSKANSNIHNRSRIRRVHIGDGVTSIGQYCFYGCYALKKVSGMGDVTSIGSYVFNYCYSLSSITIPSGVTSIGASAFYYCYSLSNITIPSSITDIGDSAFYYCYSLSNITIPSDVTNIRANTFVYCYSFSSITIPSGVTSIGTSAFNSCYGMAEYHILPSTPPELASTNAFLYIPSDCIIYVPYSEDHSILEAYKNATNWSTYASKMQEEPA